MIFHNAHLFSATVVLTLTYTGALAKTMTVNMTCDGHPFEVKTEASPSAHGNLWRDQTLLLNGRVIVLQDKPASTGQKALPAAITGWQCVAGTRSKVLILAYSCASDEALACDGKQEWMRLVAPDGHLLDAGLKPADDRLPALLDALGIAGRTRAGIQMREVMQ